jgi:hypothetical protein
MKVVVGYEGGRKVYADLGPGGGRGHARGPIQAYGNGGSIVVGNPGQYEHRREKQREYRAAFVARQKAKGRSV